MYQEIHPSTGETVDIYADNIPMTGENTMVGGSIPVKKHHFEVEKNELFYGSPDRPSLYEITEPKRKNDVLDVLVLKPVIKSDEGQIKINEVFELILEYPMEEEDEGSIPTIFTSLDPEILEIDEEGNMTPKVNLGQVNVYVEWPSGVGAQVLVTIGDVSEILPYNPELGGEEEKPEPEDPSEPENPDPEQPEDPDPTPDPEPDPEPEPDEPENPEPEDPVVEAKIMYGLMPIANHMENLDAITADDLANANLTRVDVSPLDKTLLPVNENDIVVVLVPADSGLIAYRDNGFGSMETFSEEIIGCNGQKVYSIEGVDYRLYAEFQLVGASDYFIYVV